MRKSLTCESDGMKSNEIWTALGDWPSLSYYCEQLSDLWQRKLAVGMILSTLNAVWVYSLSAVDAFSQHSGADKMLVILLGWMMIADLVFGLWSAFKLKQFKPQVLKRGIVKWPLYCVYIILVAVVNVTLSRVFPLVAPVLNIFIGYLVCTEVMSVIHKLELLGWRIPKILLLFVHGVRDSFENKLYSYNPANMQNQGNPNSKYEDSEAPQPVKPPNDDEG